MGNEKEKKTENNKKKKRKINRSKEIKRLVIDLDAIVTAVELKMGGNTITSVHVVVKSIITVKEVGHIQPTRQRRKR